ncbi:hypothetical protein VOLCADRAFT_85621 [Volvox carteri f. nagariensis]|uniref:UBC core domain-containing protein n=1 Tax=Volvox carteri f. nagariensis TaxID=3068 RepID=D8UBI3_VOLCA|nr:uncharacterized protein VOLCADRAFT_85621 [Volvox carteri f. nagariensis]EFJ42892.1 hypothetical protein VOLCADRAFT_85621 [Volvox carteri f. nagariensis]|eukprot:XP_002955932.1 hypothetical protein VOLCADRAFT_85621 [Volvox carteri f. nagariensis]
MFRKNRLFGFVAKPATREDGSVDLRLWHCRIPGPSGTSWEGGSYPLTMIFSDAYPTQPPECLFPPNFFHPNVYPDGKVCLSLLNDDSDLGGQWAPSISISQILQGIQELLTSPYIKSPAQIPAYVALKSDKAKYERMVREQAKKYPSVEDE